MKSKTKTLIEAMQILSNEIHSEDGVANAAIFEASERLSEQQKRIAELEQELQKSTDQNDLILDEFIRVKCLTRNTEIHQLCERAHIRMRQNVPVIERNHRMEKRIVELRKKNAELEKALLKSHGWIAKAMMQGLNEFDCSDELLKIISIRDIEQQAKGLSEYKDALVKIASEMPLQLECRSKGSSFYNWAMYYAREITLEAQTLDEQAKQLKGGAK